MNIKEIIEGKKEWKAHVARVKSLPEDYQIVYKEIEKYLYKVVPFELTTGFGLLTEIVDLFEDGAKNGKEVLQVTGNDVAGFCDELIKDCETYADISQEIVNRKVEKSMKKITNKMK